MANFFKQSYLPYIYFAVGAFLIFLWVMSRISKTTKHEGFENTPKPYEFVMYYADWCPHCQTAKPEFKKLGSKMTIGGTPVKCEAIEAEQNPEKVKGKIAGYPTIQLYDPEGNLVDEYSGSRTKDGFVSFLEDKLNRPHL